MSEEEKKAIETLKEIASDDFDTLGDDISPKMAQNILNFIKKLQKGNKKLIEKSRELIIEKQQLTSALLDSTPNDKIREKIKELEITRNRCITDNGFTIMSVVISNFKELLKEK